MLVITPYESIGSIHLGMSVDEMINAVGNPVKVTKNRRGEDDYQYSGFYVRMSPEKKRVVEVSVVPEIPVMLNGIDIFALPQAFRDIVNLDGHPYEFVGFIILLNLGITMTGFHDGEVAQRAITVFEKGRWDHLRPQFNTWINKADEESRT